MTQVELALGVIERPEAIPLRTQRSWLTFDSRLAALRWAQRHAPTIPERARPVSAHPRPVRTSTGEYALFYDTGDIRCPRWVLNRNLELEPSR